MTARRSDFDECAREPIHLIGGIQTHGALLATDRASRMITHASANCMDIIGHGTKALIGQNIEGLVGRKQMMALSGLIMHPSEPDIFRPWPTEIHRPDGDTTTLATHAYHAGERTIFEFFAPIDAPSFDVRTGHHAIDVIRTETTITGIVEAAARGFRALTGFDRVMVYRFHDDDHGEVVAETTELEPRFLHLHYPASDIPPQARLAYLSNLSRSVGNVDAATIPIEPVCHAESDAPLDLTFSKLRALSPVHLEYLRNMSVAASMSISIVIDGKLWGLIACHHSRARVLSSDIIMFCELAAKVVANQISQMRSNEKLNRLIVTQGLIAELSSNLAPSFRPQILNDWGKPFCDLFDADGMVGEIAGERVAFNAPPGLFVDQEVLRRAGKTTSSILDRLDRTVMRPPDMDDLCRGALYIPLSLESDDFLLIFRNAITSKVDWAGDPNEKSEIRNPDGSKRLGPRRSFAVWKEMAKNQCPHFSSDDLEIAERIRQALIARMALDRELAAKRMIAAVEAQRDQFRQQLTQGSRLMAMAEMASSIGHEVNQPLTAIINFAEALRITLDVPDGHADMARAKAMSQNIAQQSRRAGNIVNRLRAMVQRRRAELQRISLVPVLKEAVQSSVPVTALDQIAVSWSVAPDIPDVMADPIQLSQVVFNLIRNAADAMDHVRDRRIRIGVRPILGDFVETRIWDTGPGLDPDAAEQLFKPFVSTKTAGMGLGLALSRSIIEAHGGTLRLDPEEKQTCFVFTLPLQKKLTDPS